MDIDMKAMKAEMGGAFMLVFGVAALAGDNVAWAIALAVTWMAFTGAHLLPVVTWCHIMTGDLGDAEGNWMANGLRLVWQVVGALLAVVLMTEMGDIGPDWAYSEDMWIAGVGDDIWGLLAMVAAGAVFWQIHTRCDTAWVSAFAILALGGAMGLQLGQADQMASSLLDGGSTTVTVLADWVLMSAVVGAGALLGNTVDGLIGEEE
ncbi:MAG: hypothetical protein QF722_03080 [Candidatus Thalassarchaeaceae archaeon]|nr:hypothetical protein [Candidatus Thalassarchaeaceae archaeon]MDP6844517.1 hypothetical protein [Candidatus Thalassarchaeaceae archaeon]